MVLVRQTTLGRVCLTFFWTGQACVCDPGNIHCIDWHICTSLTSFFLPRRYKTESWGLYWSLLSLSRLFTARSTTAILVFHPWESHRPLAGSGSCICHLWNVLSLLEPCLLPHCATFWAWPPHLASLSFQRPQSLPVAAPEHGVLALGSPGCASYLPRSFQSDLPKWEWEHRHHQYHLH